MSHALRHAPEQYGLTLDSEGWVAIDATAAHQNGIAFYLGNDNVWLADAIPAKFMQFGDEV